jgi:2-keto-4-pentenoate hydratase/2-oxohepta-3-ene-1,7-dioic acid hydratase in catechol pathway
VGVGIGFTPPKFLRPGDRVTIGIEGLGRLTNRVKG